jgi:hypothetical protein
MVLKDGYVLTFLRKRFKYAFKKSNLFFKLKVAKNNHLFFEFYSSDSYVKKLKSTS